MIDTAIITGFEWDKGNTRKSQDKHDLSNMEAEQIFFNHPLLILSDAKHSHREPRYHALGKTDSNRLLHITFTLRARMTLIRIISARDMHKKRGRIMPKSKKAIPDFKTETEERLFWEKHDSSDYLDWDKASLSTLPDLKPSTKTISLRLSQSLLERIKIEANKRDMPYQSLIKVWLSEDVDRSQTWKKSRER